MLNVDFKDRNQVIALFPKSAGEIRGRVEDIISKTKEELEAIIKISSSDRTFENSARALDKAGSNFSMIKNPIAILQMVSSDKDVRNACVDAVNKLDSFAVDAFNDVLLYGALKSYVNGNAKNEELNEEERYFLKETMDDFIRSGLDLPKEELDEIKRIKKELAEVSLEFETNIVKDRSQIKVKREDLAGLKDDFIENLKKSSDGLYILGCDTPTLIEVMQNCSVESTRRDLYLVFNNRAYPENIKLLDKIIALRDSLAKKLGFESFAHINLDSKMAKSPVRAESFLMGLLEKVKVKARKEIKDLTSDLPKDVVLTKSGELDPWNLAYVKERYKKKHFDVDEREIAKYFPLEKTIDAVFDIYQQFLGLNFKIISMEDLWNEEVQLIEVYKKDTGDLRGYILLDLYPRPNKYSHACHAEFISTIKYKDAVGNEIVRPSAAVVIANFPKSTETRPSLLKHNDVGTFFHEFGHAMHGVLGRTEMASFSGTDSKLDFVEVPSQMFEEWLWDKEMLKKVSSHYETGESLPDSLIDRKIGLKRFDSGHFVSRQCVLSLIALELYKEGSSKNSDKIVEDVSKKHSVGVRFEPKIHFQASFGHLTEYGACYYSYMWSKVFALDIFEQVKKQGLLDGKVGQKFISDILGRGGSVEPDKLLRAFLGREPNQDAFLKDIGV